MLESFFRAYEKQAFSEDKPCQVSKQTIQRCLRILQPIHSLGDVIPSLIVIFKGNLSRSNENKEDRRRDSQRSCTSQQASSVPSENSALISFIDSRPYQSSEDITRITLNEKIQNEKQIFLNLLDDETNVMKTTFSFWTLYDSMLPLLSEVSRKIFSISASNASIERFFSICG
ncbi:unnamed protein product, partial [Brachionus calyciflorus]